MDRWEYHGFGQARDRRREPRAPKRVVDRRIDRKVEPQQVYLVVDGMTGQDAVNSAKAFNEQLVPLAKELGIKVDLLYAGKRSQALDEVRSGRAEIAGEAFLRCGHLGPHSRLFALFHCPLHLRRGDGVRRTCHHRAHP